MNLREAFYYPWLLPAAIPLVAIVWYMWLRGARRSALRFSSIAPFTGEGVAVPQWSLKARHVLPALRTIAVVLLVISVARPRKADEMTRISQEGVAIQLVVDRSGSMAEEDFADERGRPRSRLAVVKDVVTQFIHGNGDDLPGRKDDLIGLTVFARFPDSECPLTRDHSHLIRALERVRVPVTREEDGTAIGDALLLGLERIRDIGRRFAAGSDFTLKSRAVVLLTDGEQNAGQHHMQEAAEAARALGVKIYTIGAAPRFQEARAGPFRIGTMPTPIDERGLKRVAQTTGGQYFRATDAESLQNIYREIDKLERTQIDEQRYYLYHELAYRWGEFAGIHWPPPLLIALAALCLEVLLANTRLRKIP